MSAAKPKRASPHTNKTCLSIGSTEPTSSQGCFSTIHGCCNFACGKCKLIQISQFHLVSTAPAFLNRSFDLEPWDFHIRYIPDDCVSPSPRSPRSRCCRGWDLFPPWSWADRWGWWRPTTRGSKCLDGSLWWTNITWGAKARGERKSSRLKAFKTKQKQTF